MADSQPIVAAENRQACSSSVSETAWDEAWLRISFCPDYEVSDHGNVRSHLKKGNHKKRHSGMPRLLRLGDSTTGYKTVSLPCEDGKYRHFTVHSIVAKEFHGDRPEGMEVAHLNGIKKDNRAVNLKYVTHQENEYHKRDHGTAPVGESNGASKLLGWQVAEIKFLADKGIPQSRIADLFGVSRQQVFDVVSGKLWSHIAARTDIPKLLAEVERLNAENARLRSITTEHR